MRTMRAISTTAMILLLGFAVPAYARQDKPDEKPQPPKQEPQAKPEKQEQAKAPKQQPEAKPEKQAQAKAPKQEPQAKPEKQEQAKAPKQEPQAKPEKQEQAKAPKQEPQAKPEKQAQAQAKSNKQQQNSQQAKGLQQQNSVHQSASSNGPQRTQEAMATQRAQPALRLSARGSGRIPDERFQSNFGREHQFQMGNPVMVGGYSRFQCGGYWFGYVQPWPVGWYYTDQFYIDYVDGGYYMYDPYYPGARFAITVVI